MKIYRNKDLLLKMSAQVCGDWGKGTGEYEYEYEYR